jgi:hypothetical protein
VAPLGGAQVHRVEIGEGKTQKKQKGEPTTVSIGKAVACTAVLAPVLQAPVLAVARTAVLAPVLPALVLAEVVRAGADPGCNVACNGPSGARAGSGP